MRDLCSILGAEEWDYSVFYRVKLLAPIRYLIQAVKTFIKLVESRPNVVIVQNPPIFATLTCVIYSRIYPVKTIIDHHSVWSMDRIITNPIVKFLVNWVEKFCISRADLNTTYTECWECVLNRIGARKALTVYDFVNEEWTKEADFSFTKSLPEDRRVIAVPCSGGHALERPDLLIEACKDLNATVVITGAKKFLQKHIGKARELNVENVVFAGFLSDEQYRGLIAFCDFAADSSLQPFGIPHVITEALAAGRPIIVGRNPAVEKLLGEKCPFIVPENDVDSFRRAFVLAFENQNEYVKLAARFFKELKRRREIQLRKLFKFLSRGLLSEAGPCSRVALLNEVHIGN